MSRVRRVLPLLCCLLALSAAAVAGKSPEEQFAEKLAKRKPADADGHYRLGLWCRKEGLAARATEMFQKAVSIDPDHRGARKELGYVRHGDRWLRPEEQTRAEYEEKVAALAGPTAEDRYQLGLWCLKRGLLEEAAREFEEALKLDPEHAGAKAKLAAAAGTVLERKVAAFRGAVPPSLSAIVESLDAKEDPKLLFTASRRWRAPIRGVLA